MALLALGFSCVAVSLPLALLDPTGRCLSLVALAAACLFLRWGLRHGQTVAHVAGVLAAFVAYLFSPALLTTLLGFRPDFGTWGLLGFLAFLIGLGALLVKRQAPEKLRQAHGILMAFLWLWITGAALTSVSADAALLLAIALGLMLLAGIGLLWSGLAKPESERIELGLALIVAWLPAQLFLDGWLLPRSAAALVAALAVAGVEFGALILAARRGPGRWLARRRGMEAEELGAFVTLSLRRLTGIWLALSGAACLLLTGWDALILALVVVGLLFLSRIGIDGWAPRLAFPARLSLLPLLQLAVLLAAGGHPRRDLPLALLDDPFALLPWIAIFGLLWRGLLLEALGRRRTLNPWAITIAMGTAWGYLVAFLLEPQFAPWANVTLIAVAAGWAAVFTLDGLRDRTGGSGWAAQIWAGLGLLHAFTAGWLHLGSGLTPWILLGVGAAEYALGALLSRTERGAAFSVSCHRLGLALPLAAGFLSLLRIPAIGTVWAPTLVTFLVSLFYMIVAAREPKRIFPRPGLDRLSGPGTAEGGRPHPPRAGVLLPGSGLRPAGPRRTAADRARPGLEPPSGRRRRLLRLCHADRRALRRDLLGVARRPAALRRGLRRRLVHLAQPLPADRLHRGPADRPRLRRLPHRHHGAHRPLGARPRLRPRPDGGRGVAGAPARRRAPADPPLRPRAPGLELKTLPN